MRAGLKEKLDDAKEKACTPLLCCSVAALLPSSRVRSALRCPVAPSALLARSRGSAAPPAGWEEP